MKKHVKAIRRPLFRSRVLPKCVFCDQKIDPDYKNIEILERFTSDRGKILSAEKTGICRKHQRSLAIQIKRARHLAFLPFTPRV